MVETNVAPNSLPRRTFLYRTLEREGAHFEEVNSTAAAMDYGRAVGEEIAQAQSLGLADLSPLPHTGFKGTETVAWLRTQGVAIGDENNAAWAQTGGGLAARLADNEMMILGDISGQGDLCERLERAWSYEGAPRCYPVPRGDSYARFVVTGEHAAKMFAKLCGVDLRPNKFPSGAIAQTSVARMSVIVIRHDLGKTPAFHLLFDSASA
ncbi:MAG: hypothetical protein ACE5NW_09355, partial [Acidiferrobacterales bacterium]